MASDPLVSVISIFFNAAEFLTEAIESVLAQTYPHWELVLVDDGSSDGSAEIARRYADSDPGRIRYVEHPGHENRGISAARNLGVREALGEYVAFLDADDVYLPQKLDRQAQLLAAYPEAAMVYGATLHWHGWTGRPEDIARDQPRKLGVRPDSLVPPPTLLTRFLRDEGWPPGTCGVLVRRSALDDVGGFDEHFRGLFEDQSFFYKLCARFPVYVESGRWDRYRQHPASLCERARRRGEWDPALPNEPQREFFFWVRSHLHEQGIDDSDLSRALWRRLLPYEHPTLYRIGAFALRLLPRIRRES